MYSLLQDYEVCWTSMKYVLIITEASKNKRALCGVLKIAFWDMDLGKTESVFWERQRIGLIKTKHPSLLKLPDEIFDWL